MDPRLIPWPLTPEGLAAWWTQLPEATTTPWRWRTLVHHGPTLLPRFATVYPRLRALPRRVRRALQRKWACSLAGVALLLTLQPEPNWAADFTAANAAQLINALTTANGTAGTDTITLTADITLTAVENFTYGSTGLPVITSTMTIQGQGHTIRRDPDESTPSGTSGGGVANLGRLTVLNSTVTGNAAGFRGGGVFNFGTLTLTNSTVSGNAAAAGGGVSNYASTSGTATLTLTNSTVSGNAAAYDGGGISNTALASGTATLTLTDSTVSGNAAGFFGGGVSNLAYGGTATLTLTNSTLSGNSAYAGGGVRNFAAGWGSVTDLYFPGKICHADLFW
jgi:Putative pectate lyase-like adhesive domain